uniref:RING-type domain-containing protein n=1 Tax=Skeletonema marinoi TaxID=267567 RepID=A0A7S2LHC7_9STRA|mmetsp:Transcript_2454/g.3935  ORF Transcript_2454/g.3935 Transcript_2454/m.3935 type:complete len:249 (+) Transcript_2454:95-841(+)
MKRYPKIGQPSYVTRFCLDSESTHVGDCPICLLPLRLDPAKSLFYSCCSKMICKGCDHANKIRQREEQLECTCPFCRQKLPKSDEEVNTNFMNRAATNNDPVALRQVGMKHYREGDYDAAFKCHTKAVDLGDVGAKFHLAHLYMGGEGVEKDMKMGLHYYEEAAIAGHPRARYSRACYEMVDGRIDRAVKHWIIAANLGDDDSIQTLKGCYARGEVSKEEFAAALRAHYAAVDATKSPQREAAEAEEG